MEGRERDIFDEEAAVAELEKVCFCHKILIDKKLFEIGEGEQNAQKPP